MSSGMLSGEPNASALAIRSTSDGTRSSRAATSSTVTPSRCATASTKALSRSGQPSSCATRAATMEPPLPNIRETVIIGTACSGDASRHELVAAECATCRLQSLQFESVLAQEGKNLLRACNLERVAAKPVMPVMPDGHPATLRIAGVLLERIPKVLQVCCEGATDPERYHDAAHGSLARRSGAIDLLDSLPPL